jgi:hypothetical protein
MRREWPAGPHTAFKEWVSVRQFGGLGGAGESTLVVAPPSPPVLERKVSSRPRSAVRGSRPKPSSRCRVPR